MKLVILSLLILLQGCASQIYYKSESEGVITKWEKKYDARYNTTSIGFSNFTIADNGLYFDLDVVYTQREYSYDKYRDYYRWYHAPDYAALFIPLFGWMVCVTDLKECFGYTDDWEENGTTLKNERFTGNTKDIRFNEVDYDTKFSANLIAFKGDETLLEKDKYIRTLREGDTRLFIDLRDNLIQLEKQPDTVVLEFSADRKGFQSSQRYTLSEEQFAQLQLESDTWLSLDELKRKYFSELKTAIASNDHSAAVLAFQKVEKLDFEKPESFWYRYAYSLSQTGNDSAALEKARYYLKVAKKKKYQEQAAKIIAGQL